MLTFEGLANRRIDIETVQIRKPGRTLNWFAKHLLKLAAFMMILRPIDRNLFDLSQFAPLHGLVASGGYGFGKPPEPPSATHASPSD